MIRIKDYIFPEENILYIRQKTKGSVTVLRKRPNEYDDFKTELEIEATFDDIEWNYGENENNKLKEDNKELVETNMTLAINNKELEEENKKLNELVQFNVKTTATLTKKINKAIEYIEELYTRYIADYSDIERLEKILKGEENENNKIN